jgi:eukaryotic translation initiation factor 2-alpha kinase 4
VTDPKSIHYQALLAKLFIEPAASAGKSALLEDALDFTYDDRQDSLVSDNEPWQRLVKERLVQLFRRHGAVDLPTPLLAPVTGLTAIDKSKAARLLDESGHLVSFAHCPICMTCRCDRPSSILADTRCNQVQLPSDGSMSFARYISRKAIDRMKRYHFGSRYQSSASGGQPRSAGEARYDIISPLRSMASEAEMLEGELVSWPSVLKYTHSLS